MSLIYAGFAVLAAWWIVFIVVAIGRKQMPVFLFLLVLFFAWAVPEVLLIAKKPEIATGLLVVPFIILIQMMRVIPEYQRGVLFRLGRMQKVIQPGFNLILPFSLDIMRKVDMRTFTIDVSKQEIITRDNVAVIVDAVVYFNLFETFLAVVKLAD